MGTWQKARYRPPRLVAEWRAKFSPPPWNAGTTHALSAPFADMTACGRPVPATAQRVGYGAVTCPRCKGTTP